MKRYIKCSDDIEDYRGYVIINTYPYVSIVDSDDVLVDSCDTVEDAKEIIDDLLQSNIDRQEEAEQMEADYIQRTSRFLEDFCRYSGIVLDKHNNVISDTMRNNLTVTLPMLRRFATSYMNSNPQANIVIKETEYNYKVYSE